MRDARVKTDRITLQVREVENDGQAIVFLHCSGANLMMWMPVVPRFRDRFRLILVDLRGHGQSDRPSGGYHMDEMARDVRGLMDALGLERAHIVGSSLGAEVGLSLAANEPDRVLSLVCDGALSNEAGPYGTWTGTESEFAAFVAEQLERVRSAPVAAFPSVEALVAARRERLEPLVGWNEHLEAVERHGARETAEGTFVRAFGRDAMADYLSHVFHIRLEAYYRRVRCPLLLLPGAHVLEDEREAAAMRGLAVLADRAQIAALSDWNHPFGWLFEPEEVSQTLLAFFDEAMG